MIVVEEVALEKLLCLWDIIVDNRKLRLRRNNVYIARRWRSSTRWKVVDISDSARERSIGARVVLRPHIRIGLVQ